MIPRGSKVIGQYQASGEVTGHARLQIQWREIITPQGVNILLTNANVADSMGMSGAEGYLNNRYLERYGIPYALSTLTNVLLLSIATNNNKGNNTYSESIYNQSQTDLSTIVQEILTQQRAIKPTIEIKAGSRIFIVPTHHIWFPKPKNNEVMVKYFK
ncbi:TrbI/VirB10 family protein [Helicobacter sp. MIT 11-5569]|uniref:TrbI/VirB10 family protein n=1 Tax=Helicobacter sp. MIT 11-5569 TaxID=1548151 RepID=UPI000B262C32|nr:TrbI/VirB10 family protein [Helicobacter sp. MIT 11-5569]